MKTYVVLFDPLAKEEALEAAGYIARDSSAKAAKWFAGLEDAINSLSIMPGRCNRASERPVMVRAIVRSTQKLKHEFAACGVRS